MKTVLIPTFNNRISSRLDCTDLFRLVNIDVDENLKSITLKIPSKNEFEKLNSIISMHPDLIICNGLTNYYKEEFSKNNIDVISWVYGEVNEILEKYICGELNLDENNI